MRDPRIDPQPGDVIKKHSATREVVRTVIERRGREVYYGNNSGKRFNCWLFTWKAWAQDALVVTTAPEPPKPPSGHIEPSEPWPRA